MSTNRKRDTMKKFHFHSTKCIGTYSAETQSEARDEFIKYSFFHLEELRNRYRKSVVRSVNFASAPDTIYFTVDNDVVETWQLRPSWGIKHLIRKLIGD